MYSNSHSTCYTQVGEPISPPALFAPGCLFLPGYPWELFFLCPHLKRQSAQGSPIHAPCSSCISCISEPSAPKARLSSTLGWPTPPRLDMTKDDPSTLSPQNPFSFPPLWHPSQQASCQLPKLEICVSYLTPSLPHLSNKQILIVLPPKDVFGFPPLSPQIIAFIS